MCSAERKFGMVYVLDIEDRDNSCGYNVLLKVNFNKTIGIIHQISYLLLIREYAVVYVLNKSILNVWSVFGF
jgi:hypothetical protein